MLADALALIPLLPQRDVLEIQYGRYQTGLAAAAWIFPKNQFPDFIGLII